MPRVRSKVLADMPFLAVVKCQAASNQVVSGVLVLSKIVPAVTDVWWRQIVQASLPRLSFHGVEDFLHAGQINPSGQRNLPKILHKHYRQETFPQILGKY